MRGHGWMVGGLVVVAVACSERTAARTADGGERDSQAVWSADTVQVEATAERTDAAASSREVSGSDALETTAETDSAAVAVVRRYYAAIAARDYPSAYALWAGGGTASGQTLEEFAAGFAETASVEVDIGRPGRVEGAAGSRYIAIPVVVRAVATDGETQRFEGMYTLRRSVVDGATEEQRSWRIHSAELRRAD